LLNIKIIKARPGKNTTERILELIQDRPEGISIKELYNQLNQQLSATIADKVSIGKKQDYRNYYSS